MINNLLKTIASDLNIFPYFNETDEQYTNRLIYSAASLWILMLSCSRSEKEKGISKTLQTTIGKDILTKYLSSASEETSYFSSDGNRQRDDFIAHIRNVYEETGYLLANNNSYSVLLNNRNNIPVGNKYLFFGIPKYIDCMSGLGIYASKSETTCDLFNMMLRDRCSPEEYLVSRYNILDFSQRDINLNDYKFFNPKLPKSPSSSWEKEMITNESIVGNQITKTYFRVINDEGTLYYAEETFGINTNRLTGNETRRLYIALKHKYGYPVRAWINKEDDNYYRLKLSSHLPNREYYFLLLMSWPAKNAYDRNEFILTKNVLSTIEMILENIGIDIRRKY